MDNATAARRRHSFTDFSGRTPPPPVFGPKLGDSCGFLTPAIPPKPTPGVVPANFGFRGLGGCTTGIAGEGFLPCRVSFASPAIFAPPDFAIETTIEQMEKHNQ